MLMMNLVVYSHLIKIFVNICTLGMYFIFLNNFFQTYPCPADPVVLNEKTKRRLKVSFLKMYRIGRHRIMLCSKMRLNRCCCVFRLKGGKSGNFHD